MTRNRLLEFNCVRIHLPRKFILACLRKDYLTRKEKLKIRRKLEEIEKNLSMLEHARTVVENCVDKETL